MLISVIIPSYNSEKTIQKTVLAIKNQQGLDIPPEIIVVDDGSKDKSLNLLNKIDGIRVITQNNSGPATARNKGAKIAKGDILVFTDSDTVPHYDWLKKLVEPFYSTTNIVATTGTYSIENKESKLAQLIQSEIEYKHSNYKDFVAFGGSYNFAIKKDLFEEIGGFNEEYRYASGEDVDICYKILNKGYKIRFVKDAVVGHFHPEKLYKYLITQLKHGFWRAKLYYDHPNKATGDDYTGLKEIIETLSAGFTIVSPLLYLLNLLLLKKQNNRTFFENRHREALKEPWQSVKNYDLISLIKKFPYLLRRHSPLIKGMFIFPTILLLFIEYTFVSKFYSNSIRSQNNLPSKLYATIVFSLRAIYRTFGFIKGLIYFSKSLLKRKLS